MDELARKKKNLIMFPLGTVGRDMVYSLFTNYLMLFILYTRSLTAAQLGAVTAIMAAARVFDALNDPLMGNIIERTRTRWGKFKPWLVIGIVLTGIVVYLTFNTSLTGWSFIWFFGCIYFLFSIAYTMHDISYWGMIPALGSDADTRNQFTARATLFAGVGGTLASLLIPMLTTGENAIGGNASVAYGRIALVICILAPVFLCFTIFGVRENRDDQKEPAPPVSLRKIVSTIGGNDQLLWISLCFLLQQIGNGLVLSGVGQNYIYFEFGYEGGLYSLFNTVGMVATAFLMVFYPAISRRLHRKALLRILLIISMVGYVIMLGAGLFMAATMIKFWLITVGFMLANFGQYGFYLVMMISILNTVEYNELRHGARDEAIIASLRPFITKLSSAIYIIIANVSYIFLRVTETTNRISAIEQSANMGTVSAEARLSSIAEVISGVQSWQRIGLLLTMTVLPAAFMLVSYFLYRKHYRLDEEEYDRICAELAAKRA